MGKRKDPYNNETTGWKGNARTTDINNEADQIFNNEARHEYRSAYDAACEMMKKGEDPDKIRQTLDTPPQLLEERSRHWIASNQAKRRLYDLRKAAVEDALNGRPPKYS